MPRQATTLDPVAAAGRYNPYAPIHKAQRHLLAASLTKLGSLDASQPQEITTALEDLRFMLAMIESHSEHEHNRIHPLIARTDPRLVVELETDHSAFESAISSVETAASQLEHSEETVSDARAYQLYLSFARFVGHYLTHLHKEETKAMAALIAGATDEELQASERDIMRDETWPKMRRAVATVLPLVTRRDRAAFLTTLHMAFPVETTREELMRLAGSVLDARCVTELESDLCGMQLSRR